MKTGIFIAAALFAASALPIVPAGAETPDIGDIVFVGDSITQANGTDAVSYRYSLWKHFVDSGVAYSPVGSMTIYQNGSSTSSLVSTYLGQTFDNTNEGHFGWDVAWVVSGESQGSRPNTGQNTGGLADWIATYSNAPETATILMGVNDLSRAGPAYSLETILANTKSVVETLQANSPGITVHVFSVLPSAQASWGSGRSPRAACAEYDALLKAAVESGAWNTETSVVLYHDITAGFDPTSGVHTYDALHPKAQGELIVAANMARALGLEQRTAGLTRRGNAALASQASFGNASGGNGVVARVTGGQSAAEFSNTSEYWTVNDAGHIVVNSPLSGGTDLRTTWGGDADATSAHEFTVSLTLKMNESSDSSKNFFGVFGGNGLDQVGVLFVGESGIYWGDTSAASLLYGQTNATYMDQFMMQEAHTLRMAWIAERENGAAEGFYVWLDDMLIGEALSGNTDATIVGNYKDTLLFGDIGKDYVTSAEIFALSFDATTAWAPSSLISVPEPSAFGLFAGLGALALVAARRRRKK
ncbi:MAG: GDSL-type esterase/lipase family protein [Candidatus Spyradosoma sp.]